MKLYYRFIKADKQSSRFIVILHGLYGASDNWLTVAHLLNKDHNIIIPDMRNHGKSTHSDIHTYDKMIEDITELFKELQITEAVVVGHSMGGKTAMGLACKYPDLVSKLIVIDIAPKIYDTHIRGSENHQQIINIFKSYRLSEYSNRTEIANDLKSICDDNTVQLILKNIKRENGVFIWKLNTEAIAENIGNISGLSFEKNCSFEKDCLFIKGENSDYISNDDINCILHHFPNSQVLSVKGGHRLHSEQPHILAKGINMFVKL